MDRIWWWTNRGNYYNLILVFIKFFLTNLQVGVELGDLIFENLIREITEELIL
jgi:hypothetical protein